MAPVAAPRDQDLDVTSYPPELELGVIKEARRRQHRRRLAAGSAGLAATGLTLTIIFGAGGGVKPRHPQVRSGPSASLGGITPPAAVFVQDPYMGVACHIANSIACDRVGLSVWLRRPAIVTATVAGAPLKLNAPQWSYVTHDSRGVLYVYAGFLQPAGLTTRLHVTPASKWTNSWFGANAPFPLVRFRIDYGHGDVVFTQERVYLSAGWG